MLESAKLSEERYRRGYTAQARFFWEIDAYSGEDRPEWLLGATEAVPYVDNRGIDGFVLIDEHILSRRRRVRIPIQIKTGVAQYDPVIGADSAVQVLIRLDMPVKMMMWRLMERIKTARYLDFSRYVSSIENKPVEPREEVGIARIIAYREKYQYHLPALV